MNLTLIGRTDRRQGGLKAALSIYRRTILPEAQNPEKQILYWIDHSKESLADEFRRFALQREGRLLGYLQSVTSARNIFSSLNIFAIGRSGCDLSASINIDLAASIDSTLRVACAFQMP